MDFGKCQNVAADLAVRAKEQMGDDKHLPSLKLIKKVGKTRLVG